MLTKHTCYRNYLKDLLVERVQKNSSYSLRALARDLDVSPAMLSEVLKGHKTFSPATALKVSQRIGLTEFEQEYFLTLTQWDSAKTPEMKVALAKRLVTLNPSHAVKDLSLDLFRIIADWYHLPILEMTRVAGVEFTPRSLAKQLGISVIEAETALDRLLSLELIEKVAAKKYKKTSNRILATAKIPNSALREYHRQMLNKAIESLETQAPSEKLVGSETFALDPALLEEANAITEEYFNRMVRLSGQGKKRTHVYHLGVQFFKLTKGENK
ncbi:MAG: TIGR02147 family protein [Bdellovibrio sp.]